MSPLPHEQVIQLLRSQLLGLLPTMPILRGVLVTLVWEPGMGSDIPPGFAIFRPGSEINPELILACIQQNVKLGMQVMSTVPRWSAALQVTVKQQEEKIHELEEKLRSYQGQSSDQKKTDRPVDLGVGEPDIVPLKSGTP